MKEKLRLKIMTFLNSLKSLMITSLLFFFSYTLLGAEEKIDLLPSAPYDRFIIYQALIFFWIGIIGLIIIIKMKLKELERIQNMGIDREEKDIPFLD